MRDEDIKKKVRRIIHRLNYSDIRIDVDDRIVSLGGKIRSWEDFIKLGSLVGDIKNVEGVVNTLQYPGQIIKEKKNKGKKYKIGKTDVVIIGGGVIGCSIARELSQYKLDVFVVEKNEDVACGTTKANNAMIHTGIGEERDTLKQHLCVEGHSLFEQFTKELNVPYKKCGMWILVTVDSLAKTKIPSFAGSFISKWILPRLILLQGKKLGIPMKIVKREHLLRVEPNLTKSVLSAVFSPTYGVTSPYLFTIALAENAIQNGVKILLNTEVINILTRDKEVTSVVTTKGIIDTRFVINAAGLYADDVAEMAGAREYTIHPKKGATLIFDKEMKDYITHSMTMVQLPLIPHYKGGGIMTTIDGNIQWGPTIVEVKDKDDVSVDSNEIKQIFSYYSLLLPAFPKKFVIKQFSGVRACTFTEDFIIRFSKKVKGFIHVAGIQSPGLTAAPAIAEFVRNLLKDEGLQLDRKNNFHPHRKKPVVLKEMSDEDKNNLIKKNPLYGRIICRCEQISEGEIVDAIHSDIPAINLDAIKRRTRAGMGRCQGGFCLPHVAKIISRETGIPFQEIQKNSTGSRLFIGPAKCLLESRND